MNISGRKKYKYIEFIEYLTENKIFYKTLGDEYFSKDVFKNKIYSNKTKDIEKEINEIINDNKDEWAQKLLECKINQYNY